MAGVVQVEVCTLVIITWPLLQGHVVKSSIDGRLQVKSYLSSNPGTGTTAGTTWWWGYRGHCWHHLVVGVQGPLLAPLGGGGFCVLCTQSLCAATQRQWGWEGGEGAGGHLPPLNV